MPKKAIMIRMGSKLYERIQAIADATGRSVPEVLRGWAVDGLHRDERPAAGGQLAEG